MKVLLATDGSETSNAATDAIRNLALADGDEIKVISIIDMAVPLAIDIYGGYLPDTSELEKAAKENSTKALDETKAKLAGYFPGCTLQITTEVLFGTPESRIVETAEEMK